MRVAVIVATSVSLASLALAADVEAAIKRHIHIPPQELGSALRGLAKDRDFQIVYASSGIATLRTQGASGVLTDEEALRQILEGMGFTHRYLDEDTVTIVPLADVLGGASGSPGAASMPLRLAQGDPAGASARGEVAQQPVEEIVVTGKIVFTQNDAFGATKMGLPLKDTPQTVNVVTADLMEAASIQTFEDFYKVDASSGTTHALDGYPRNFYRGFYQQGINAVRVDGFRMPGNINLDLAVFDRFEVIKGPTSTLYGQNNVGGALNAVSKLPQDRFAAELGVEAAQYDQYRADLDVTGPIGDKLSYRVIGAYADSESFIDFASQDLNLLSGALQYEPGDATSFTLRASYQNTSGAYHYAPALQLRGNGNGSVEERVRAEGLKFIDVPRSRFYGMPWNDDEKEVRLVQFQGEHVFENGWRLRAHAQHSVLEQDAIGLYVGGPFNEAGLANFLWNTKVARRSELQGGELNVFGDVELFGRRHTLFFGIDRSTIEQDNRNASIVDSGYENSFFNAFTPDYGAVDAPQSFDDYPFISDSREASRLFGATAQLILRPTERLSVLLGGRQSKDTLEDGFRGGGSLAELESGEYDHNERDFSELTVQTGATFAVTKNINVYATYGETFNSQFGRIFVEGVPEGDLIDPETGEIYEIGLKASPRPDLAFTAAVFDMQRSGIAQDDFAHPDFVIALGTQQSRGVELALQGRLAPALSLNLSAAFLDAEYVDGELKGLQSANAPKFGLSAYGTYEILAGPLKGLGFGVGAVHKRGLAAFDYGWSIYSEGGPVVFKFGNFTEFDARVFYDVGNWSLSLTATNLFDEKYYSQTFDQLWWATHVNPPRTLRAKAMFRF